MEAQQQEHEAILARELVAQKEKCEKELQVKLMSMLFATTETSKERQPTPSTSQELAQA